MDFVKREDQNVIDEENYKVYMDNLQKSHQIDTTDYQHTQISMEQLHQAMQSSLNSGTIVHNFQLPLSPRQMSTLMLKTNLRTFNEIPAHFRNLELNLAHSLTDQNIRHEEIQNLNRDIDISLLRSLGNEIDLQNTQLSHNITEDLRLNDIQLAQLRSDLPHDLSHEIDLTHHLNRQNIEQEILQEEARRMVIQSVSESNIIEQNLGQRLDQIGQRLDQVGQRIDQRLINIVNERQIPQNIMPMQFHIKSEQEDDSYLYDNINQGIWEKVDTMNGQILNEHTPAQPIQPETQMYSIYPPQSIPALNPIDLYARQNYPQNFVSRENPQNLVVHRPYENASPYQEEFKKLRQDGVENGAKEKVEEPKENFKPNDNKIYFNAEFNATNSAEKSENDTNVSNKITEELSLSIKGEYICYKCNEVYPSKRILKQHVKSCAGTDDAADKLGKLGCSQCPYRGQSPAILKIHERIHSGEKPFSCNFCDYKSGQKNNVAKHILVHMKEKPFRCQYCDYRCAQKNNLVVHERTHTGYKPFACPYCEYRTVQKPNLVKHMYLHTDQKPFSCDMCSYRCVQKTNLTKHKQRHLNENGLKVTVQDREVKPYRPRQKSLKCPQCHYRCVQKSSMEKHVHFKHNMEFVNIDQGSIAKDEDSVQNLSVKKDSVEKVVFVVNEKELQS